MSTVWKDRPRSAGDSPQADEAARVSIEGLLGLRHAAESVALRALRPRARESGIILAPFRGRGMEFEESRPYQPGDDLRSLDWRVMARTGKPYTKLFREERERPVLLWVDYRRPMFFATRGVFKSVLAARTAAVLAWSALSHGDRVGGLVFSESVHDELRPKRGKMAVLRLISLLASHPAWEGASNVSDDAEPTAGQALERLLRVARPGSLVFLISDFRSLGPEAERYLARLARHSEVVAVFTHDPMERELPPAGLYRVTDGTRERTLNTRDDARRDAYRSRCRRRRSDIEDMCRRNGVHFMACSTADNIVSSLQSGLAVRH